MQGFQSQMSNYLYLICVEYVRMILFDILNKIIYTNKAHCLCVELDFSPVKLNML